MAESALLNIMVGAVRKAGRALTRDFGEVENLQVSRKGPADFVSNADRRAEQAQPHEEPLVGLEGHAGEETAVGSGLVGQRATQGRGDGVFVEGLIVDAYRRLGYAIQRIPLGTVAERADWVLARVHP